MIPRIVVSCPWYSSILSLCYVEFAFIWLETEEFYDIPKTKVTKGLAGLFALFDLAEKISGICKFWWVYDLILVGCAAHSIFSVMIILFPSLDCRAALLVLLLCCWPSCIHTRRRSTQTNQAIDSPDALASQQLLSYWAIFGAFFTIETSFE